MQRLIAPISCPRALQRDTGIVFGTVKLAAPVHRAPKRKPFEW